MRVLRIKVPATKLVKTWVNLIASWLVLTPKEQVILTAILANGDGKQLTTNDRRLLSKQLNISPSTLNNNIKRLKDKQLLTLQEDGRYVVNPVILPDGEGVTFEFVHAA